MMTPPRRHTLNSSRSCGQLPRATRLGGVVIKPSATPVILEIALVDTGSEIDGVVRSWDIGNGKSVAVLLIKDKDRDSGPTLRLLA